MATIKQIGYAKLKLPVIALNPFGVPERIVAIDEAKGTARVESWRKEGEDNAPTWFEIKTRDNVRLFDIDNHRVEKEAVALWNEVEKQARGEKINFQLHAIAASQGAKDVRNVTELYLQSLKEKNADVSPKSARTFFASLRSSRADLFWDSKIDDSAFD